MKKYLTMILVATMAIMTSCAKNVKVEKSVDYEPQPFTSIEMEGVGNIIFTQDKNYRVHAEGDSARIAVTEVTFKDGKLTIRERKHNNKDGSNGVNYYISAPTLVRVESNGVGSFESREAVTFDNDFEIESNGVGQVKIKNLTCQNFKFDQSGVGASEVQIKCQKARIDTDGVGACEIDIEADALKLSSDGVGAVKVKGHVKKYESHSGSFTSRISDKSLVVGE